jgi:hypothetical protein|tara:strand:+ start:258 stop:683 length:426 start_codon:yes stop_codon:yes gene_type:complete
MTTPVYVPKDNIEEVFPIVKDSIEKALQYSGNHFIVKDIYNALIKDEMQLWVLWNLDKKQKFQGCGVTKILQRTNSKALNIFIVTGRNRKQWQTKMPLVEDWAKQNGCTHIETYARPGWSKLLKEQDYKITHYLLEKKLEK